MQLNINGNIWEFTSVKMKLPHYFLVTATYNKVRSFTFPIFNSKEESFPSEEELRYYFNDFIQFLLGEKSK